MDFLKQLVGIQVTPDVVCLNLKWMFVWPFVFFNIWIYWRAGKSLFSRQTEDGSYHKK